VTFCIGTLGPYRIERSEEYTPGGPDNSYAELIRVRGSKPVPPFFMVPSHLYKHSETELGLYLKERKNLCDLDP
jgi:phosphoenolpyruvate synthase/pyruvate phosphate dikinase